MVRVYVNGVSVDVPQDAPVIEAVEKAGYRVPLLCYLEGLFDEATCRVCVVVVNGRVVPACRFPVSEGAKVLTDSPELTRYRRLNFELLLSTHRLRCWSCSRKSRCRLVELSRDFGVEGIPVCAECPLVGEDCLVAKGLPCLGPLTVAGCSAECTRQGLPCTGCRGFVSDPGVWEDAMRELYGKYGVEREDLEEAMKFFWRSVPERLRRTLSGVEGG